MISKKLLINIFSNWTNLVVTIILSFFISPIIIHSLGNENYGVWTLIVSITGYFTVLDFGINTAIIRFISKYNALNRYREARKIFNNSFIFFGCISISILIFCSIFGFFIKSIFSIDELSNRYIYFVFIVVGINFTISLSFSVLLGSLRALQEFFKINVISILSHLLYNLVLVLLLLNGYSLLSMALLQLFFSIVDKFLYYLIIKIDYKFLKFQFADYDKKVMMNIFNYSIFSFIIAVSLKVLFYTDSVVIGAMISVTAVAFYAIPMTLMTYIEKFIYASISVLTPVISSNDAIGDNEKNQIIYSMATKYSLLLSLPVLFVLFTNGASFINLWIGAEYAEKGESVLKILSIGYAFYLSQIISNSILKGISRHKVYSYILLVEAFANIAISILLSMKYGIIGIALGTTIPLIVANVFVIPYYVCSVLNMNYFQYIIRNYLPLFLFTVLLGFGFYSNEFIVSSYLQLVLFSIFVSFLFFLFSVIFVVDAGHKKIIYLKIKKLYGNA